MNPCVIIPVYNHAATLLDVAREALRYAPVIVVDDGSTDGARALLESEPNLETIFLRPNQGKGRALAQGFARARELGHTHAITIDADGQHDPDQIPEFIAAAQSHPEAIIVGSRDLLAAGAPAPRRFANAFSNFWHWAETGRFLPDTQSGFRAYPLDAIAPLAPSATRYGYELEILVHAAWLGVEGRTLPVQADYARAGSQQSHFRPILDFARLSAINARLTFQALAVPPAVRRAIANRAQSNQSLAGRLSSRAWNFTRFCNLRPLEFSLGLSLGVGLGLICPRGLCRFTPRRVSKISRDHAPILEAGFDLTRPAAGLVPIAIAALLSISGALDILMPSANSIVRGLVAWLALVVGASGAAGLIALVLALFVSAPQSDS